MIFQLIISFSLIVLGSLISCYAADSSQDLYKTSKVQNLELEMQLEKSAHQLEKMRLEQSKYDAESKQREAAIPPSDQVIRSECFKFWRFKLYHWIAQQSDDFKQQLWVMIDQRRSDEDSRLVYGI